MKLGESSVSESEPSKPLPPAQLIDRETLAKRLSHCNDTHRVAELRTILAEANSTLNECYRQNLDISDIVSSRAHLVDLVLDWVWSSHPELQTNEIALAAVGGYGRSELMPYSDIDLLILTKKNSNRSYKEAIASFLATCWDLGLDIGQSVRSVKQCAQEARKDITVATALMESRAIAGSTELLPLMTAATTTGKVWPTKAFLKAKVEEQKGRHAKYHDVDYALEPNVKNSPGGLRDIQTIAWVTKRHFGAESFRDLTELGFLKPSEEAMIHKGQQFLWKLRYGLHYLSGRAEDRLLFNMQRELAKLFGYVDDKSSLGVEKLMKQYYRAVANLRELNDALLQHLDEAIVQAGARAKIIPLNKRFQINNGYIEVTGPQIFERFPFALLEIFVLMAQDPKIEGIRASTIRLLRENRRLIDNDFRHDLRNLTLFMELLRSPHHMALHLRRMARYGILGRYLPEFGQITGQMQHDLFHIYTVDAHTLQVVENMRRLYRPEAEEQFPLAADIARQLPKPELLYIAGLYHDIAKGRGGDHSKLGKIDARNFCHRHRLAEWDTNLVCWLVDKHLLMSMTAQRKDISDPLVINEFAEAVGDKSHLDYLYTLTVADIRATNPDLWNSWRASLLSQLYINTLRALKAGSTDSPNSTELIRSKKALAAQQLISCGLPEERIEQIWANNPDEYFERESVNNIVWHTQEQLKAVPGKPLVAVKELEANDHPEGATLIFIHTEDAEFLFAKTTAAFERLRLNIVNARVITSLNAFCLDTYTVLEPDGKPVGANPRRIQEIETILLQSLAQTTDNIRPATYRRSRKLRYFNEPITTVLTNTPGKGYSTLEINCPDQPGILATLGKVIADNQLLIVDARITTLGERVEDIFCLKDHKGRPIIDPDVERDLLGDIENRLNERLAG